MAISIKEHICECGRKSKGYKQCGICRQKKYAEKSATMQLGKVPKKRIPIKRTPIKKNYKPIDKTKKSKVDRNSIAGLIKECDYLFSRLIRQLHADKKGIATCYTCTKKLHWKELQAGHYISRGCIMLRFWKFNVRVQCRDCNEFKRGNLEVFARNLFKENEIEFLNLTTMQRAVSKVYHNELIKLKAELIKELDDNKFEYTI